MGLMLGLMEGILLGSVLMQGGRVDECLPVAIRGSSPLCVDRAERHLV